MMMWAEVIQRLGIHKQQRHKILCQTHWPPFVKCSPYPRIWWFCSWGQEEAEIMIKIYSTEHAQTFFSISRMSLWSTAWQLLWPNVTHKVSVPRLTFSQHKELDTIDHYCLRSSSHDKWKIMKLILWLLYLAHIGWPTDFINNSPPNCGVQHGHLDNIQYDRMKADPM